MNQMKLLREGKKWIADGIITDEQLDQIIKRYPSKDPNFIIILFAILLTGLGFLTFIMSDWARVPHFSRVLVMILFVLALYIIGDILYRKSSQMLGVSFIILGYIAFGAGMLLVIDIFSIATFHAWPFVIWAVIGLLLYVVYPHPLIFVVGILVTTIGQISSGASFASFDWLLFLVLLFGYAHFVYRKASALFGYLFAISLALQMLILTMAEAQQYYWLIIYYLALYILGDLVPKHELKAPFKYIGLLSMFIVGMYQSFLLQEEFFMKDLEYQFGFFIVWIVLICIAIGVKLMKKSKLDHVDFILFLPVFFIPFAHLIGLACLFVFSIAWLLIGYRYENSEKIMLGTIAFLLSTFTVYIQYAWEPMNKSLFFLIGGLLLFLISFSFEKQRRLMRDERKGGEGK